MVRSALVTALLAVSVVPGPALGAKRPWDIARFSACVVKGSPSPMDPEEFVTTLPCAQRDVVEKSQGDLSEVTLDRSVAYARRKAPVGPWAGVIRFKIGYKRQATFAGGNPTAGYAHFSRATLLWPSGLEQFALIPMTSEVRGCGSIGSGFLRIDTCGYNEYVAISLDPALVAKFRAAMAAGPTIELPMKLFADDGATFETNISAAEVVAATDAVPPP